MKSHLASLCLLAMGVTACHKPAPKAPSKDPIISVDSEDAEMNAAIARARASLPLFWSTFAHPTHGESNFHLKVRITSPEGTEHFWCSDLEKEGDRVSGTISNDAEIVTTVHLGQEIDIPPDQISDWLYTKDGKIVGDYTVRPLLPKMSREQADEVTSQLAELPP